MRCYLNDKQVDLVNILGEGGEARVYEFRGEAIKIWKKASDPSIMDSERSAFAARLAVLPMKMAAFPNFTPKGVVTPTGLAKDSKGQVIGYSMPMVSGLSLRKWSENRQVWHNQKRGLSDLWYSVKSLHDHSLVWGDANDLNVIMDGIEPHIIDADSLQFGKFRCTTFTQRFADPLLMRSGELVKPHNEGSDWYAWALMAYISMTGLSPWDGTPTKDRTGKVPVWDSSIKSPKWAVPHTNLSPEARTTFENIFLGMVRSAPNLEVFESNRRDCAACGKWVWGPTCGCGLTERSVSAGAFYTCKRGETLHRVWVTNGKLHWVTKATDGNFFMDSGTHWGPSVPAMVDNFEGESQECSIGSKPVYLQFGSIWQVTIPGSMKRLGQMIKSQSRIWGGTDFGFGLSRLEESWMPIIIDGAVLDSLGGPHIRGRIYDAAAYTSETHAWLGIDDGQKKFLRCWDRRGQWVTDIDTVDNIRGAVAYQGYLFVPLDGEIVRYSLKDKKAFAAPVHSKQALNISREGLTVWDEHEIRKIQV